MICRFCGETLRSLNQKLFSTYGEKCRSSTSGRHVAVSQGNLCVYCGGECRTMNGRLFTKHGERCPYAPSKSHCLQ